jgi:D-alanine-D-alanine ligase
VGVYIVNRPSDLPAALKAAFGYGDRVLVERYLNGPEITVPLVGNAVPRTLPLIEIISENEFYDYEAKYTAGMCHHIIPARIEDAVWGLKQP